MGGGGGVWWFQFYLFVMIIIVKIKTHSGLGWFDFLEVFSQLLFATESRLALRTFITDLLNSLRFLAGGCFLLLGQSVRDGLAQRGCSLA